MDITWRVEIGTSHFVEGDRFYTVTAPTREAAQEAAVEQAMSEGWDDIEVYGAEPVIPERSRTEILEFLTERTAEAERDGGVQLVRSWTGATSAMQFADSPKEMLATLGKKRDHAYDCLALIKITGEFEEGEKAGYEGFIKGLEPLLGQ